jgi:hypothetical protein
VTNAAGEAGVHFQEVVGIVELASASQNNGLSKGYPGKQTLKKCEIENEKNSYFVLQTKINSKIRNLQDM